MFHEPKFTNPLKSGCSSRVGSKAQGQGPWGLGFVMELRGL